MEAASVAPVQIKYGGFWIRFLALLIDGVILGTVNWVLTALILRTDPSALQVRWMLSPSGSLAVWMALATAIPIAYFVLLPPMLGGTIGKLALGLRVVDKDLRYVSYLRALGRYPAFLLSYLVFGLGLVAVGLSDRKRGLHDRLAGTLVVKKEFALPRPRDNRALAMALVGILLLSGVVGGASGVFVDQVGQELRPAVAVSEGFLGALQKEDYETAFALCHPDLQKELGSAGAFQKMLSGMRLERWTFTEARSELATTGKRVAVVSGSADFSTGKTLGLMLALYEEGSGWQVAGFRFR